MLLQGQMVRSYADRVKAVLALKTLGLETGFNVYTESQLRSGTAVTQPAIYVVQAHIAPTEMTLPFVAVHLVHSRGLPFEMGRAEGHEWDTFLHVFARSRGQRDDLAAYLADPAVFPSLSVYNYNASPATLVEVARIDHERTVISEIFSADAAELEGSWRNHSRIRRIFWTMS